MGHEVDAEEETGHRLVLSLVDIRRHGPLVEEGGHLNDLVQFLVGEGDHKDILRRRQFDDAAGGMTAHAQRIHLAVLEGARGVPEGQLRPHDLDPQRSERTARVVAGSGAGRSENHLLTLEVFHGSDLFVLQSHKIVGTAVDFEQDPRIPVRPSLGDSLPVPHLPQMRRIGQRHIGLAGCDAPDVFNGSPAGHNVESRIGRQFIVQQLEDSPCHGIPRPARIAGRQGITFHCLGGAGNLDPHQENQCRCKKNTPSPHPAIEPHNLLLSSRLIYL